MLFGSRSCSFYKYCFKIRSFNSSEKIFHSSNSTEFLQSLNALFQHRKLSYFSNSKLVETVGGKGGDGSISFLQLWCGEKAGPDGGDGGNGGHVIFKASREVRNLNHVNLTIKAADGEKGRSYGCNGANGKNVLIKVPVGTIIRHGCKIICNFDKEYMMFVGARGGSGGKGNHFFGNMKNSRPKLCEYGNAGEKITYQLEVRRAADIGLIGCPKVGKSTLLNRITRARSQISSHEYTLRPNIGFVHYDDYTRFAVADLPGLIEGSHRDTNRRFQFLRCVDQCELLMFILDISLDNPWDQYFSLINELAKLNPRLINRPKLIIGNKVDKVGSKEKLEDLECKISHPVIPISAKWMLNISHLLIKMREYLEVKKSVKKDVINKPFARNVF